MTLRLPAIQAFGWAAVVMFAVGAARVPAQAAQSAAAPELVGVLALALESDVAEQLGLTEGQREKLLELVEARESEALELAIQLKNLPPAERTAKLAPFRRQSESQGLAILSEQQRARLQQIRLTRWGLAEAIDAEVSEKLKLTSQQQEQLAELLRQQFERLARADEKTAQTVRAETDRKFVSLLEPQQRVAFEGLVGAAPAVAASPGGSAPRPQVPVREEPMAEKALPAKPEQPVAEPEKVPSAKPKEAVAKPEKAPSAKPEEATQLKPEKAAEPKPEKGAEPKPDKAAEPKSDKAAEPKPQGPPGTAASPEAKKPVEASDRLAAAKPTDRLRFNFRYQPWKDVLEWFAESAGLSLIADATPKGTFNYSDIREYTTAEALDLLNSVLLTKGYTLVRKERMLFLVNVEDGIPPVLVDQIPLEQLDKRGEHEVVRVVFQVQSVSPEEAELEIRKLIGPQGAVVVLPKARQVVVTETAGRLRIIRRAIEAIEKPEGAAARIRPIELKYSEPQDVLNLLRQLLDIPADKNSSTDGSVHIVLDPMGGRLLVTGKPDAVARVEEVVKAVDVPDPANPHKTRLGDAPQLEVYSVTGADPNSVLQVLQTLLVGMPEVRLSVDPKTGNLVALGRRAAHATIKATLDQLQRDARRLEVFPLRTLDPQLAVAAITKLFAAEAGPGGPKVDADPYSRQLLVRGSEAQIQQIRDMLQQMGESAEGKLSGGTLRVIPLTGRAARTALEDLEEIWPTVRSNRIRVVTPSGGGISTHRPSASAGPAPEIGPEMDRAQPSSGPGSSASRRESALELLKRLREEDEPPVMLPLAKPDSSAKPPAAPSGPPLQQAPVVPAPPAVPAPPSKPESGTPPGNKSAARPQETGRSGPKVLFATQLVASEAAGPPGEPAEKAPAPTSPPPVSKPSKPAPAEAPKPPAPPSGSKPSPQTPKPAATPPSKPTPPKTAEPGKEKPPVVVRAGPGGLIIASQDTEALDELERLLGTLAGNFLSGKPELTVFYLKHAKANAVAETLDQIFGGGTLSGGGGQSLIGDLAGAALGDVGGGLLGALLGGGGQGGSKPSGAIQITPDSRLNALIVYAKPADADTIEQLLKILDERESPEEILASPKPRLIPVYNTQAEEIATVVRQVYQDRMAGAAGAGRPPTPQEFVMALRNMRGGRGGGSQRGTQEEQMKMSIGVDARTNSLVVVAPDVLFQEVKELVDQLDDAAVNSSQTLQVVTLQRANSDTIRQALSAMVGGSVQFGSTRTGTGSTAATSPGQSSPFGFGFRRGFGSPFGFPGGTGGMPSSGFQGGPSPFFSPFMGSQPGGSPFMGSPRSGSSGGSFPGSSRMFGPSSSPSGSPAVPGSSPRSDSGRRSGRSRGSSSGGR